MAQTNQGVAITPRLDTTQIIAKQIPASKWAVWKSILRDDGKLGKIPHSVSNNKSTPIGHDDPTQWVNFNTALQWYIGREQKFSGLGLLVGSNPKDNPDINHSSGLVALDIDNCLDDEYELSSSVGGDVRAAIKTLQSFGVYIEVSPSGKGLRALWRGVKPEGIGERWKNFKTTGEIYDGLSTRFVTITGHIWKNSSIVIIEPNDAMTANLVEYLGLTKGESQKTNQASNAPPRNIPTLTDVEIINKIKQSGQGKGKRLFEGDMSTYGGDHSSADAALCALISRWTDDKTQVLSVWGASALSKRDKFKRVDYQSRTISFALDKARSSEGDGSFTSNNKETQIKETLLLGDGANGVLANALSSWGGKVPKTLGGAEKILSLDKRLAGVFAYDEFSGNVLKLMSLRECLGYIVPKDKEPKAGQCWSDADTASLTLWLESVWGLVLKSAHVHEAIDLVARRFTVNTVVDSLNCLKWDGRKRLDSMLSEYFNADINRDTPRYLSAIGRAWMIGTVARAFQPGCKHDHVLTIEGGQGYGKSKAIRTLASAIAPQAYREGLPPLTLGQEAVRSLSGAWIVELAELAFMDKTTTEHIKAFITKESDSFRRPYGRVEVTVPRTVSFAATTNQNEFVRDTAARRYWVFKVTNLIDIQLLESVAPQLWAEAVEAFKAGESWWLTDASVLKDAEASQNERLERNGFDELIAERIIDKILVNEVSTFREQALHLWGRVSDSTDSSEFNRSAKAFADALTRSGFVRTKSKGKSYWSVGSELEAAIRKISP